MEKRTALWGLVHRKERWALSWRGWLALWLAGIAAIFFVFLKIHPFFAINRPVTADYLVVEGWTPDYALAAGFKEFKAHPYKGFLTTGCPLMEGYFLTEYPTFAHLAAATVRQLGVETNRLEAIPSYVKYRDRTYASALALKKHFQQQGRPLTSINILTLGAHARRTRLLFEKALPGVAIGVIAVENREFDPHHWWQSSSGVREVIGESLAYLYARFLFRPDR